MKAYLANLGEFDQFFMKKYEYIQKSIINIRRLLDRSSFIYVSAVDKQRESLRKQWLEAARSDERAKRPAAAEKTREYAGKKKVSQKKTGTDVFSRSKTEKKDTVEHSLELFRQGKTIEQIAAEGSLTVPTVESHMAKAIGSGRLLLNDCVSSNDSAAIESAINEFGSDALKAVFDALNKQYSLGKLKACAAVMNLS